MQLRYFAWVREQLGCEAEELEVPAGIDRVDRLLEWLATRWQQQGEVFRSDTIRVAVNQQLARPDTPVGAEDEVAIFPPMTGG